MSAAPRTVRGANTIFVATDKNIVAALRAKSGELVWRQVLREDEPVHNLLAVSGSKSSAMMDLLSSMRIVFFFFACTG